MRPTRRLLLAAALLAVAGLAAFRAGAAADGETSLPRLLSQTGLYRADAFGELNPEVRPFTPQYVLWSDGAAKRRWLRLPPGAAIDASSPDAWQFPPGTRLWKEFAHDGRPVETRYIERLADGRWRFASYVWNEDGRDAVLAPAAGIAALPARGAPDGRYEVPGHDDCRACHESAAVPVLGASAVQLSAELRRLVDEGWLRGLPAAMLARPPRIAATSPGERAALGYLHANCGHCHNDDGMPAPVRLVLAQRASDPLRSRERVLRTTVDIAGRFRSPALADTTKRVVAGHPAASTLALRMRSRDPRLQMPPLGTRVPDPEGLALIERWIANDLSAPKEPSP